jgi:KaiC domain protein
MQPTETTPSRSRQRQPLVDAIETAGAAARRAPPLVGVASGVEGLDELFFQVELQRGRPVRRALGGYPTEAVVVLTGVPETGKSLMAEQFAVKQAALGHPVLFVSVENPAPFVSQALELRARAMDIDWAAIRERLFLVDAATHASLREDLPTLLATLAYALRQHGIERTVIDSVTGLYEAREILARSIVREIYNFLKQWKQTAILVSQKRSAQEETSAEAAGGYAVSHIVDCTIVLAKRLIESPFQSQLYGVALGEVLRTLRIDGCRLSGHDTSTHVLTISELGLVQVGPRLADLARSQPRALRAVSVRERL